MEGQHFRATAGVWGLQEASRNAASWQFEFPLKESWGRIFWTGVGDTCLLDINGQRAVLKLLDILASEWDVKTTI